MRVVVQRVINASVEVDGQICGSIKKGLLVFIGVGDGDSENDCKRLADKIINLRIFSDENDKINLSLKDVNGELLIVSQFTLYADCKKGNRPNFTQAAKPDIANALYEFFVDYCKNLVPVVETGIFGADMKVKLLNDGPFTIVLE
ncbi:MAG TPA: D-aminoacyl-tRNA deacylase [Ruminococcus sp.]|nr:D-tyrosyl-tRNA(Tyr) deacylase [Ruminococcus sp.]MDY3214742.1 D-aminoacyl-tRNA deacylase [Ruminococcus sp.]CDF02033.1 d-tyrosyl-tRNA(Tyr) deacylase [Ruminococcus sp. CAG:624]